MLSKRIQFILFAFFFSRGIAFSQDSSGFKPSPFIFNNLILHGGFYFQGEYNFNADDYKRIATESVLLKSDFSKYHKAEEGIPDAGWSVGAQAGFKFYNKKRKKYSNTEIRSGIFYSWRNYYKRKPSLRAKKLGSRSSSSRSRG